MVVSDKVDYKAKNTTGNEGTFHNDKGVILSGRHNNHKCDYEIYILFKCAMLHSLRYWAIKQISINFRKLESYRV